MTYSLSAAAWLALVSAFVLGCGPSPQPSADTREADAAAIREADLAWSQANEVDGLEGVMPFT